MHSLTAITALGANIPRVDEFNGLRISECSGWALASVFARMGREADLEKAVPKATGLKLPDVGTCADSDPFFAFWTGPDQWMIEAPHNSHEDLAKQLKSAFGDSVSVTEQTDGWVRFDVEGPRCADVFELLCNANVRAMATGAVTRTSVEHLGCFLICRAADTHFSVIGPRSSAASLHHTLVTAAKSAL